MRIKNLFPLISILLVLLFSLSSPMSKSQTTKSNIKFITQLNGVKEYRTSNGIRVLLKQNNSIPLITFSVWYKVGSRNEKEGNYGLAHFLEHMMFKGTRKFKKGQISEIIQGHGGVFNAFTSNDCTAYYETISPKYLEKVIEIESDRMKNSLLDNGELNLERTVVLSELEGDLNNPVVLLDQKLRFLAYEKSPYKHPTIGYEEDIKNVDSKIMRDFYTKYYSPNNSTIILAGDFQEDNALELINKYFGSIPKENNFQPLQLQRDPEQKKEKRLALKRAGTFKIFEIGFHISDAKDEDIYPLNILEEILIRGKKSPLNKSLIEKGLATEIYGGAEVNTDPGLFYLLISLTPKATHKMVEKIVINEIDKLIKTPPSKEEILGAINRIKANYLFNLDGTYAQVANLGFFEVVNSWKQSVEWTDKISKVNQEQILNVLKKYFKKENRTIGYFTPIMRKGEKYELQPLNLTRTQSYKTLETTQIPETKEQKSNSNNFKYKKTTLKDGSTLLVYKNIDLPITYISGAIKGGSSLISKEKENSCQLIARTLEKGSKNYSKDEIEKFIDYTGSHFEFACDEESFKFNVAALNDNLNKTITIFSDLLLNPAFPKAEVKNEKEKFIAETIELKDNTQEIAKRRFTQLIYPKDHPYYTNNFKDDIELIKKISLEDLTKSHETIIKNNKFIITIVSNLDNEKLKSIINILEKNLVNAKSKNNDVVNIPDTLLRENPKKENIYINGKMQSDVFLGHAGSIKRTDPDFYKMNIANYILGGSSLASRLSKKVRDNSGLVYTIYSYVSASYGKGEFGIYFGSNNKNVDNGIELTKLELKEFVKNGITENELKKAKAALIDSFVSRNLATNKVIANTLTGIEFYNLGENYINSYPKIINSLTLIEINDCIKKYIHPNKLNIVIAGEYKNSQWVSLKNKL